MKWNRIKSRMAELESRQSDLLEEYNGIAELIKEDLEEQDLKSFQMHVNDIAEIMQDLEAIRDELEHLGGYIDDAVDDARMERKGMY